MILGKLIFFSKKIHSSLHCENGIRPYSQPSIKIATDHVQLLGAHLPFKGISSQILIKLHSNSWSKVRFEGGVFLKLLLEGKSFTGLTDESYILQILSYDIISVRCNI